MDGRDERSKQKTYEEARDALIRASEEVGRLEERRRWLDEQVRSAKQALEKVAERIRRAKKNPRRRG